MNGSMWTYGIGLVTGPVEPHVRHLHLIQRHPRCVQLGGGEGVTVALELLLLGGAVASHDGQAPGGLDVDDQTAGSMMSGWPTSV